MLEDRLLLSLLGVGAEIGIPDIDYDANGTLVYDSLNQTFEADAFPTGISFTLGGRATRITNPSDFQFHIQVDNDGNLVGGVVGDDLVIEGEIDINRDRVSDYSGVLLTGEIADFGYLNSGTNTDQYDFRLTPTGGALMPFFEGKDIGMVMTSLSSTFDGTFTVDFNGMSQGVLGPIPQLEALPGGPLTGQVFVDANNDGIADEGEVGISDVIVTLTGTDNDGNTVNRATVTNELGQYSFDTLTPGEYTLTETHPVDYLDGIDSAGTLGGVVTNDQISVILVDSEQAGDGYNFGELEAANLTGQVVDADNVGIAGAAITLTGTNDLGEAINIAQNTDASGGYSFADLRPGTYTISEAQPAGYLDGADAAGSLGGTVGDDVISGIAVASGDEGTGYTFAEVAPASLTGQVVDADNVGIAGAAITLTGTNYLGEAINIAQNTDASGGYSFADLRPGTYTISEAQPAGYLDGADAAGSLGGTVGDDVISGIAVASGDEGTGYNFTEVIPSSLAGQVVDADNVGIAGTAITLTGTNDLGETINIAQNTDASGGYSFADLRPGTYTISEAQPAGYLDGADAAGNLGGTVGDDVISGIAVTSGDVGTGYNFAEIAPASLSGLVYEDFNDDGEINFGEKAIENVEVTLTGQDDRGNAVNITELSDVDGMYMFADLRPGNYTITESQPAGYADGKETMELGNSGTVGDDTFSDIDVVTGVDAMNYNFGERPESGEAVTGGQTATIGFWQNKNGQNLLKSLNGDANATQLGDWLAATFPNIYGATGADLAGKTNEQVATYYRSALFKAKKKKGQAGPTKIGAQVMATAFATYVTNSTLAGNSAAQYGFLVTASGVGIATFNIGDSGAAFGVADNTEMTVLDILLATNEQTIDGILYDLDAVLRSMANEVYASINEGGDI